jgi:pimeloyl-ACP methyl ester carboxylesterase
MRRAYCDIPEGQIHYQTEGTGEPVLLLLHQVPFSSDEYSEMMPILAKNYRVIAMDILGYGNSDKPPKVYQVEDYVRSIISFLDATDIGKSNVVGHHTGATLAVALAVHYPDRVDKLVLSGCSFLSPEDRRSLLNSPRYAPMEITKNGSFLMREWEYSCSILHGGDLEIIYKAFLARIMAGPRLHDAHYAVFRYEKEPELPLIKSPTLLLAGTEDMFYNKLEILKNIIPRCRTKVIKGAGNFVALEKPYEFADAILDFLKNPQV